MTARFTLLVVSLFTILSLFFFLANQTLAQTNISPATPPSADPNTPRAPEAPSTKNWDAGKQSVFTGIGIANIVSCFGAAIPLSTDGCPQVFLGNKGPEIKITYNGEGGGALGASSNFIAMMYDNQPVSGVQYIANLVREGLGIERPVYAQIRGTGVALIDPILRFWQIVRNVAYIVLTAIFLVTGFMIMFRKRLNQQTVVNIQNSLPNLVVALILITFSYVIAGLIIDLAFFGSQMVGVLFLQQLGNAGNNANQAVTNLLNRQNVVTMFASFAFNGNLVGTSWGLGQTVGNTIFPGVAGGVMSTLIGAITACLSPAGLTGIAVGVAGGPAGIAAGIIRCAAIGGVAGAAVNILISVLVFLVLLIALLSAMFRLFFALIGAFVNLVAMTIFGPLIILWSAVPGQGNKLGMWWRGILANSLIFPAVFGVFLLAAAILGLGDPWFLNNQAIGQFNQAPPLFGGGDAGFVRGILAYGILLAVPGVPDFIRNALGADPNKIIAEATRRSVESGRTVATTLITRIPGI